MSFLDAISTKALAAAHYLDQPQVINGAHKLVGRYGLYTAVGVKALYDIAAAPQGKRLERASEDLFVLAPTTMVTAQGLRVMSETAAPLTPFSKTAFPFLPDFATQSVRSVNGVASRPKFSLSQLTHIIQSAKQHDPQALDKMFSVAEEVAEDIPAVITKALKRQPLPKNLWKVIKQDEMVKFFGVGGLIVVAGLLGGIIHDAVTKQNKPQALPDKVKEAIFQFIANIALCAVGATAGMVTANVLNLKPKGLGRLGLILGGLSVGIFGGGMVANAIGTHFVNPLFEWGEHRAEGITWQQAKAKMALAGQRKVEWLDAFLHLDDLPTGLALAGMQIFVPFIPLFFAVSGYRTGIGYRNHAETPVKPSKPILQQAMPVSQWA